jgi:hypothetical protein
MTALRPTDELVNIDRAEWSPLERTLTMGLKPLVLPSGTLVMCHEVDWSELLVKRLVPNATQRLVDAARSKATEDMSEDEVAAALFVQRARVAASLDYIHDGAHYVPVSLGVADIARMAAGDIAAIEMIALGRVSAAPAADAEETVSDG